ncbi:MAG: DUF262 domain-containing protein [Treponema sp.]|nr:DUF262 domain-containing protein [Treponema sp.]
MSENKIDLKSVKELLGMHFFIPSYQRGYRWTKQQVLDLLNDIKEFAEKKKDEYEFYCVQPLVVKLLDNKEKEKNNLNTNEDWYEVIDGQQRLTTIYLILASLKEAIELLSLPTDLYELKFQRETEQVNVTNYLKTISKITEADDSHIDYSHMSTDFITIKQWLNGGNCNKGDFCNALLKYDLDDNIENPRDKANNVRFIWYESVNEDPIEVFTRLNIGKISLTNAELIKALFLNRSNFGNEDFEHLKLRQNEIANEWDDIEYTLQNDDFWLFLHEKGYDRPTRIDFIFDLICEQKSLGDFKNIGNDDYKTFRYFYEYFKAKKNKQDNLELCWNKVKSYFRTFKEWFDDLELYHYVGYLIHLGERLDKLYKKWEEAESKAAFIDYLKNNIKGKIQSCKDLSKQYELPGCPSKTVCKPLLLLHNIKVTIDQNNQLSKKEEYKLPVFYKFPFHLLKKENWDVEHIDPETKNELKDEKDQKEWLKYSYLGLKTSLSEDLKEKIKAFLKNEDGRESFGALYSEIEKINHSEPWNDPEHDKNKIWNFVLLDAGTNRGYGNSIFATKRSCIIGKDQGKTYCVNDNLEIDSKNGSIAFVPPVTKNVFIKYYNTTVNNLLEWSESDAKYYKKNIFDALKEFDVIDSQTINDGDNNE